MIEGQVEQITFTQDGLHAVVPVAAWFDIELALSLRSNLEHAAIFASILLRSTSLTEDERLDAASGLDHCLRRFEIVLKEVAEAGFTNPLFNIGGNEPQYEVYEP